ncbi:hypothetical protein [Rhodophyticola porphyridii]|uniref:hypothetical protein n=1 Tax=Rhodophyticola porphyridii TaxID=1852017 RepID=UPI0013147091|nr:hypothetical protein [Rhodophyticola porphyridii]
MEVDWGRYIAQVLLVVGVYYALVMFSPLPRLSRGKQFAVFGGIVFVLLFVFGLVWP